MEKKKKVPLGAPLQIDGVTLEKLSEVTPADVQRVRLLWRRVVKVRKWKSLLDAIKVS